MIVLENVDGCDKIKLSMPESWAGSCQGAMLSGQEDFPCGQAQKERKADMGTAKLLEKQRAFFSSGRTLSIQYRIQALNALEKAILKYEEILYTALCRDLGKSRTEAYLSEIGLSLSELRYVRKHVRSWSLSRRVPVPLSQFPGRSFTLREPYGVVMILSPWNYPVLLALEPLIGALAAGNCCVVKPSDCAPHVSRALAGLIRDAFPESYVAVVEGGSARGQELLQERFDYIFFTGGVETGKLVMKEASSYLTPVTLELGGKSPCIIEKSADLRLAARRVAFGKYLNCGQTCVAPDYVLAERGVKDGFVRLLKKEIVRMYGERPLDSPSYGRMISRKHFDRVMGLIDEDKLAHGGESWPERLKIAPTVLDHVEAKDAVMQEEIFGPVLPILTVDSIDEAVRFVKERPKPLALYLFTRDQDVKRRFLREVPFGGGCINDTVIHLASSRLGFGGVGESGMGSYHGRKSFETFSHEKSVLEKCAWPDPPLRYPPYHAAKEKFLRMFLR